MRLGSSQSDTRPCSYQSFRLSRPQISSSTPPLKTQLTQKAIFYLKRWAGITWSGRKIKGDDEVNGPLRSQYYWIGQVKGEPTIYHMDFLTFHIKWLINHFKLIWICQGNMNSDYTQNHLLMQPSSLLVYQSCYVLLQLYKLVKLHLEYCAQFLRTPSYRKDVWKECGENL